MEIENRNHDQEQTGQRLIKPINPKLKLKYIVGSKDCTFNKVVRALDPEKCTPLITSYLDLGRTFGVNDSRMEGLRFSYMMRAITMESIYDKMLQNWRNKESDNATLGELIKILRQHDLNAAADKLLKEFGIPKPIFLIIPRKFGFKQAIILTMAIRFIVCAGCLAWIYYGPPEPFKFRNSLPQKPAFYIPRTLASRSYISNKVFTFGYSTDIFVISRIQKNELSLSCSSGDFGSFDKCRRTDDLANQINLEDIDVRYMIINQKDHFDKLCGKTNESVHWLEYKRDQKVFRWVKSRGSMEVLQNNLEDDDTIDKFNETDLVRKLENNENILIYGGPGTGKTTLITEIGKRLQEAGRHVIYFSLPELVRILWDSLQNLNYGMTYDESALRKILTNVLAKQACINSICEKSMISKITTGSVKFTFLLDGYDQVRTLELAFIDKYIKTLQSWNVTHGLVVTTRPHFLNHLENLLQTLGHHLLLFTDADQVNFLNSYWSLDRPYLDMERLSNFSKSTLITLNSKIAYEERSTTGVALLCLVIAEVYEKDAVSYSDLENVMDPDLYPSIEAVGSIWELFDRLIECKFQAYGSISNEKRKTILFGHAYHAICSLFPYHSIFTPFLFSEFNSFDEKNLLKLGILEKVRSKNGNNFSVFYHETFVSYFVAWFVLETLESGQILDEVYFKYFLFEEALATFNTSIPVKILFKNEPIPTVQFKHKMVTQFLDSGIKSKRISISKKISKLLNCVGDTCQSDKIYACANSDLFYLFKFILQIIDKNVLNSLNAQLTSLCVLKSSVLFLSFLKDLQPKESEYAPIKLASAPIIPQPVLNQDLYAALVRGNYWIFIHVWGQGYHKWGETPCILQVCVCNSQEDTMETIRDKKQIIRFIVSFFNETILERTWTSCYYTPLLCHSAHHELVIELLEQNADHFAVNSDGENVLHVSGATHSPENFHKILNKIEETGNELISALVGMSDYERKTPLHVIVKSFDPLMETLEKMFKAGADFNRVDNQGASVIAYAINSNRAYLLDKLKYFGAIVDDHMLVFPEKDRDPQFGCTALQCPAPDPEHPLEIPRTGTPLHLAVKWGDVDSVRFLLSAGLDVNQRTVPYNETPLEIAAKMDWRGSHVPVAKVLMEFGAGVDEVLEKIWETKVNWKISWASDEITEVLNEHSNNLVQSGRI